MLCQNCKINDSTIHLYTNLNGKQKQIDLCQNCYKIIKTDPNNSLFKGMTDLNNRDFDPFGDFFNDLNNFRPSNNTPPPPPNPIRWRLRWKRRLWFPKSWTCSNSSTKPRKRPAGRIWYQRNWNCPSWRYRSRYWTRWWDYPCHWDSQSQNQE